MGEAISDQQVVGALRPFVRAAGPLVDALREADPFGLVAGAGAGAGRPVEHDGLDERGLREKFVDGLKAMKMPGTEGWARMDVDERTSWWINRVGRFTALVAAVPSLGGALTSRLPVKETLGAAAQCLLLCALAGERGITDVGERVRLIGWVLFERDIEPELAAGTSRDSAAVRSEDAETEELTGDLAESSRQHGKVTAKAAARTLWRLGRSLLGIVDELEKRPRGRFYHEAVGMVPVVGVVGGYFGERSGLKRAAKRAKTWFADKAGPAGS